MLVTTSSLVTECSALAGARVVLFVLIFQYDSLVSSHEEMFKSMLLADIVFNPGEGSSILVPEVSLYFSPHESRQAVNASSARVRYGSTTVVLPRTGEGYMYIYLFI